MCPDKLCLNGCLSSNYCVCQNFRAPTNVCDCRGVPPVRGGGAAGEVQRVRVPGVARPPEPAPAPQSQGHTECAR